MSGALVPIETLGAEIKARVEAGDRAFNKAEQHYISAGIQLAEAKARLAETKEMLWSAFLFSHVRLKERRVRELLALADGRTTLAEMREKTRERVAAHRERKRGEAALRNADPADREDPANDNRLSRLDAYSGDNEWYTPAKYVEMARTVMGRIDVDPASNDHAQQTVKASTYYTAETNGLDKDWRGTVWMNPPYSHPDIQHFTDKVLAELASGNTTEAIVLTNNSGDTGWHHALALASAARCVTRGRIRFESLTRQSGAGAMGQVFFYFGDDVERFAEVFCEIGRIEVNGSDSGMREATPNGSNLKAKHERLQEKLKEQASIIKARDDMVAIAERQSQEAHTRAMFAEADKERLADELAKLRAQNAALQEENKRLLQLLETATMPVAA